MIVKKRSSWNCYPLFIPFGNNQGFAEVIEPFRIHGEIRFRFSWIFRVFRIYVAFNVQKTKPTFESLNCILPAGMLTQPYPWFSPNPWRRHHKLWVQVPTGEFWACREIPRTEHSPLDEIRWSWKNRTQNITLMELKKTISVDPFMSVRTTCFVRWIFIVWHFVQWMK